MRTIFFILFALLAQGCGGATVSTAVRNHQIQSNQVEPSIQVMVVPWEKELPKTLPRNQWTADKGAYNGDFYKSDRREELKQVMHLQNSQFREHILLYGGIINGADNSLTMGIIAYKVVFGKDGVHLNEGHQYQWYYTGAPNDKLNQGRGRIYHLERQASTPCKFVDAVETVDTLHIVCEKGMRSYDNTTGFHNATSNLADADIKNTSPNRRPMRIERIDGYIGHYRVFYGEDKTPAWHMRFDTGLKFWRLEAGMPKGATWVLNPKAVPKGTVIAVQPPTMQEVLPHLREQHTSPVE